MEERNLKDEKKTCVVKRSLTVQLTYSSVPDARESYKCSIASKVKAGRARTHEW